MTVNTYTATERSAVTGQSTSAYGPGVRVKRATQEVAASDSSSTVTFFRIPSNARILQASRLYWDDLATSGSPTLDVGLYAVNSNITSDDDCLTDGLALSAVSTAGSGNHVIKDFANIGKQAWEYVNGQTSDPGGEFIVKGVVRDAATTATGTVACEIIYTQD
jgi:hypothetical protein